MPPSSPFHRALTKRAAAVVAAAVTGACLLALPAEAAVVPEPISYSAPGAALGLTPLGSYESGVFDESAAEIVAYHAGTKRLFVVNALLGAVDVLDATNASAPEKLFTLSAPGVANSVAIRPDGLGIIALESTVKTDAGSLVFFDAAGDGAILGSLQVGALPDMVSISKDGTRAVVANEGEPNDAYTVDPEGSVSVVSLPDTVSAPQQEAVRTAGFGAFEAGGGKALPDGVRVFAGIPGSARPVSEGLEPEYIAIDGDTAYAALQEANAVAVVDLVSATVTDIWPLGAKDHGLPGNGLDASDRDPRDAPTQNIRTYEGLNGLYMPDGINAYAAGGQTYLVTANEGDAREWGSYAEPARVKDLGTGDLPPLCATSPLVGLTGDALLGRLNISTASGLTEAGCYDELYAFGSRSFSIWTTSGQQVFDSGQDFEEITAAASPEFFNSNHSESNLEGRSDDKGPEPENLAIGEVGGRTYAFIGFERVGGIAVYDITTPAASTFVTYVNNRNFAESVEDGGNLALAGDLGPEGLAFIPAEGSPTGQPVLAVGNEVSGTTTLFGINDLTAPETSTLQVLGINDFHGHIEADGAEAGAAVLAGAVDALTVENPNTLFVSAGDNIGASTFTSFISEDTPTIDALRAGGLDASAVGNHEFDQGFADLTERVLPRFGGTQFGLGANVYDAATGEPALDEYYIEEVDGVSVGFIGTVTESTPSAVSPAGIEGLEFGSQLEAANRVAAQLKDGDDANGEADVLVLLAHDGSETADCATIATEATAYGELIRGADAGIDAILSGHTHQQYNCSFPVAGREDGRERPVLQSGQYGTTLDQLQIEVDRADNSIVSVTSALLPLTADGKPLYAADPEVEQIVAKAVAAAEEQGAQPVGSITEDILRGGVNGSDRGVESSLGNLVADIQLWATSNDAFGGEPAQIALMNPGGLRADLLYGEDGVVTYKEVATVQPFANTLFTMDLTGAQLKQVLEEQWQPEGASRSKLHLGISEGFTYTYNPDAPRGEHIVSMSFEGAPITDNQVFRVTTNSFLAAGGDNFVTLAEGTNRADTGQADLAATVAYFEAFNPVEPAPLGRAAVAGESTPPTGDPTDRPTDQPTDPATDPAGGPLADGGAGSDSGSGSGDDDESYGWGGNLAQTGANVLLIAGIGLVLALLGGVLLLLRRRRLGVAEGESLQG